MRESDENGEIEVETQAVDVPKKRGRKPKVKEMTLKEQIDKQLEEGNGEEALFTKVSRRSQQALIENIESDIKVKKPRNPRGPNKVKKVKKEKKVKRGKKQVSILDKVFNYMSGIKLPKGVSWAVIALALNGLLAWVAVIVAVAK
jgi:hypothetical protein